MKAILVSAASIASLLIGVMANMPAARAETDNPPCNVGLGNVQEGGYWAPANGDAEGIRAPINLRKDGELCTTAMSDDFASDWIALTQNTGAGITQIGWDHHWNSGGGVEYCRFWAIGTGHPNFYDCTDSDETTVYFRIQTYNDGGTLRYDVDDCGTAGDFNDSHCTQKSGSQAAYVNGATAFADQEVDHPCVSFMLGSMAITVNYGNDNFGLVGNDGSGWVVKNWTGFVDSCTNDYKKSISGDIIETWDSRNTS
jgi:hypothetical protein